MTVLSTMIFKPTSGRRADATARASEIAEVAQQCGANAAAAVRVLTGPSVGDLQVRMYADSLGELGEISNAMYASDFSSKISTETSPPSEMINVIRSNLVYRATDTGSATNATVGTLVGLQVHPGKGDVLRARLVEMADAWLTAGALQAHVTSAISGAAGPHMYLTAYFNDYSALGSSTIGIQDSRVWQDVQSSTSPSGTIIGNMHIAKI